MEINKCTKESFSVIGKEGSTNDGPQFIQNLWADANAHFGDIAHLAQKDEEGKLLGIWGAMSDLTHSFKPWGDNFTKGLYLAGVEVDPNAEAPEGWTKWTIPAYEYIYVQTENLNTFWEVINYLKKNKIELVGAVHDFTCPQSGTPYMFFPVKKL